MATTNVQANAYVNGHTNGQVNGDHEIASKNKCPWRPIILSNITNQGITEDTLHKEATVSSIDLVSSISFVIVFPYYII